jgi:hypothetical protein
VLRDHKVAREQGAGSLIQHGQVVVGVAAGQAFTVKQASAQVELHLVGHQLFRRDIVVSAMSSSPIERRKVSR